MGKYINKKLQKAIDDRKPLRWEFGDFNKYYTGLKLIAYTGYAETGRVYESVVFATTSLKGARELCAILDEQGIRSTGYLDALAAYENALAKQRKPII